MGAGSSSEAAAVAHVSDAEVDHAEQLRQKQRMLEEKRRRYARLSSEAVQRNKDKGKNVIEKVYEEDFDTIDRVQAMRFPPMVVRELQNAVDAEAERRCAEVEKTMARCLQDKMWTTWKCQKERDRYIKCTVEGKKDNDLLMAYRWKYNLGTLHGETIGRNNMMRRIWSEHFPDRELPHPWVSDQ
ncbi:hypothetical protein TraAM80_06235 [Trypanosoma rangeli]|uniref:Uncharacterized protein n=1 Tax=Trypanosoma rangeli TaxID=5698 RepID=A0A3R7LT07_TRYRA|nr:uncharacterized protein TraAM80_06235 [Trypanosoma rangeli]RNF02784.1 hypothetical protein TraAM80_06235 [Trypanosoma rangeli]|eukprot:RNF02784.1 hypothetical protein TraAM80_06235 [Trypanosoma rangeli]